MNWNLFFVFGCTVASERRDEVIPNNFICLTARNYVCSGIGFFRLGNEHHCISRKKKFAVLTLRLGGTVKSVGLQGSANDVHFYVQFYLPSAGSRAHYLTGLMNSYPGMCLANSIPGYYQPPGSSSVWGYFTPPLIHRVPSPPHQTAMEAMVHLTNNLGVAILQDHSYSRGNFAFSPYGVASVLVVLYEGARGESARQIHTAVGFPSDKDVIRIGFRDIHRHLRSYFSHEGYLSGISLNKVSSSLKPEYKKILRFYGYDIDINQSPEDDVSVESPSSESAITTEAQSTTVRPPVTQNPVLETTKSTPGAETTKNDTNSSSESNETKTTVFPTETTAQQFQNSSQENTEEPTTTTTTASTASSDLSEGTTKPLNSSEPEGVDQVESTTTLSTTTESHNEKTSTVAAEPSKNDEEHEFTNSAVEENSTPGLAEIHDNQSELEELENKEKQDWSTTTEQEAAISETTLEDQDSTNHAWENPASESEQQETETTEEIKTSLDNGMLIPQFGDSEATQTESSSAATDLEGTTATERTTQFSEQTRKSGRNRKSPPAHSEVQARDEIRMSRNEIQDGEDLSKRIRSIVNTKVPLWLGENTKKPISRIKRTLTDYLKSPHSPDLSLQLQNGMYDTHVSRNADFYRSLPRLLFLVDGAVDTPVPMMTYTNVFPYAYIPRLHAKALEFPLDDIRYKLLILLPVERRGLRQLLYDLTDFPLSNVLAAVKPARVKAMVPTFMVEGFVILTPSLQKLGIWDVFDPRKANLSGMSTDPELYVRNVEQSVTVVIRNYVEILDIQTRTMAARQMEYDFEATHPFLYFVLDTATNTALMAGQILDPLNSRIY